MTEVIFTVFILLDVGPAEVGLAAASPWARGNDRLAMKANDAVALLLLLQRQRAIEYTKRQHVLTHHRVKAHTLLIFG